MGNAGRSTVVIGVPTMRLGGRRLGPSTPRVLWSFGGVLVAGLVVMAATGATAVASLQQATDAVIYDASVLVESAEALYVALADADATSTTTFLRAGSAPSDLRERYDDDVARVGSELASIAASDSIPPAAQRAAGRISSSLPAYVDAIATAQTNSRLGNDVAAAYQRRASTVMQSELLPAATELYAAAATTLAAEYRTGADADRVVAFVGVGVTIVVALLIAQVYVAIRARRRLNLGLLVATVVVVVVVAFVAGSLERHRRALVESEFRGADPTIVLSTARILALRLASDENLDLIERGTVDRHIEDFDATAASLAGDGVEPSLFATAIDHAGVGSVADSVADVEAAFQNYLRGHDQIRGHADQYDYTAAIELATTSQARRSSELDAALVASLALASDEGDRLARDAASHLDVLPIAILLGWLVAALGVAGGIWPRIREYR